MLVLFGYAPEYEHMLLAIFVCEPSEAEKSEEGYKSLEPMEPPDQASDQGCLPEVIPTLRLSPTNPVPDQGCLPEVIPTLRSPPTNPVPETKIGPIYQCPKLHLKKFQPLPKTYIPIYPTLEDILAELGQEADKDDDKKLPGYAKHEVQDSTKKTLNQSDKDPPQSGNVPSKDKNIKKKVTFRVTYPSPLPKDWHLSLQIKEGAMEKKNIKIKAEKTSKNQKLTWAPTILNVGKDEAVVFSVMKKTSSFGSKSEVISSGQWYPDKFQQHGKYKGNMQSFHSILPGLEVEFEVEDLLETIEKPDSGVSGQNKTKNKFKFLKK
jgi:hypothetical protein